jgi:hypothetical protein
LPEPSSCTVCSDIPSGLPQPDGTQRIKNAARDQRASREAFQVAVNRFNDFILRGESQTTCSKKGDDSIYDAQAPSFQAFAHTWAASFKSSRPQNSQDRAKTHRQLVFNMHALLGNFGPGVAFLKTDF